MPNVAALIFVCMCLVLCLLVVQNILRYCIYVYEIGLYALVLSFRAKSRNPPRVSGFNIGISPRVRVARLVEMTEGCRTATTPYCNA